MRLVSIAGSACLICCSFCVLLASLLLLLSVSMCLECIGGGAGSCLPLSCCRLEGSVGVSMRLELCGGSASLLLLSCSAFLHAL